MDQVDVDLWRLSARTDSRHEPATADSEGLIIHQEDCELSQQNHELYHPRNDIAESHDRVPKRRRVNVGDHGIDHTYATSDLGEDVPTEPDDVNMEEDDAMHRQTNELVSQPGHLSLQSSNDDLNCTLDGRNSNLHPDIASVSTDSIKISDIRLLNPPSKNSSNLKSPGFEIVIKWDNRKASKRADRKENDNCIVWNGFFIFAGGISDETVLTFTVQRTRRLLNDTIGTWKRRVIDLFEMQNEFGRCKLDVSEECQLTFNIEKISEMDVASGVIEQASAKLESLPNLKTPAQAATSINSTMKVYIDNEKIWISFLDTFRDFMKVMDNVSEINIYAQVAWSVLSVIPKTVISKKNRDDKVRKLCEKLKDVYEYVTRAKWFTELAATQSTIQSTYQSGTLSMLVQQTIECAYFIREYSAESTVKNIVEAISGTVDDKIQDFNDKLDHLMNALKDSANIESNIVTLRVSEKIIELNDLTLLGEMPYDPDAGYFPKKRCLPGTRRMLINEIIQWISDDSLPQILVLSGQAGVGKSSVAHTIAETFQKPNRLGSMFCFNRAFPDRRNCLFSTISRDLADSDTLWRRELMKIIVKSAVRKKKDAETQFEELILKPSKNMTTIGSVVVIVDALDESGDREERREILKFLLDEWTKLPKNYRMIVTARPEQDIEYQCQKSGILCKRMDDVDSEETYYDIKAYVSQRLDSISSTLDSIDENWRSILAKHAQGLFQWAQTACGFIDPTVMDEEIVREKWETCVSNSSSSLYELYHQIIFSQPESRHPRFKERFKTVVGAIITAQEPLSMDMLQNIFEDIINIKSTLGPFGSLFSGVHDSSNSTMVQPLHTSLFDFFKAEKISENDQQVGEKINEYYINTSDQSQMTLGCLKVMNRMLCFNIGHLETSHLRNRDVPNLKSRVKEAIPLHLSYSCRLWSFHLRNSPVSGELIRAIRILMDNKLMYYFEALSLLRALQVGLVGDCVLCVAMREIVNWCKHADGDLVEDAMDAWTFVFDFGKIIKESTPHLYISALPLAPRSSFVSRKYLERYPGLFTFDVGEPVSSSRKVGFMQKDDDCWWDTYKTFTFSPKGECAAIGSNFGFDVWNYVTGRREVCGPTYEDRRLSISCIVFSPDGELIYRCDRDGNILTWNMRTKEMRTEGYWEIIGDKCHDCVISSDGQFIVWQMTKEVLIFDRPSRRVVKRFQNLAAHFPLAISPNGDWIAVYGWYIGSPRATDDFGHRAYTWNTRRQTQHVIPCHNSERLALSNSYIASPNWGDALIEIWNLQTNTKVTEIQHVPPVDDIRLSPDDQYIISIFPGMYSIWIVSTGELISRSYIDHLHRCFGFSHDSRAIALYARDDTHSLYVQQWDKSIEPNRPHDNKIRNVYKIWQRGSYFILWYETDLNEWYVEVLDNMTTIYEAELQAYRAVDVYVDEENVCVAYASRRGLCLWSENEGEIVIDGSAHSIVALLWLDNYVISGCERSISIWDSRTRQLVCGPIDLPYNWYSLIPVRGTRFAVIHANTVEVRECILGYRMGGIFTVEKSLYFPIAASANKEHLVCMSDKGVHILDLTGTRVGSIPFSHNFPERRRSSNGKYMAWVDGYEIKLFDVDTESLLTGPSLGRPHIDFDFSNDSKRVMIASKASSEGNTRLLDVGFLDIWDIQTNKMVTNTVHFPLPRGSGMAMRALVLSKKYLVLTQPYVDCYFWDLDTCGIMFPLYEIPSFPAADRSDIEGTPVSNKTETLNYALTAWKKASFSPLAKTDRIDYNGWVLGLQDKLLFWVPEKMRKRLWLPCMAYMPYRNYTKLNFTNFVHGTHWTQCGRRDD